MENVKELVSVKETAEILGEKEVKVRKLIADGELGDVKTKAHNKKLIKLEAVNEYKKLQAQSDLSMQILETVSSSLGFLPGDFYSTTDIDKTLGKSYPRGNGIRVNSTGEQVVITATLNEKKASHPYQDTFKDGVLLYTGEGRKGDQRLLRGNKVLYDSMVKKQLVHVFNHDKPRGYQFVGMFLIIGVDTVKQPGDDLLLRDAFRYKLIPIKKGVVTSSEETYSRSSTLIREELEKISESLSNEQVTEKNYRKRYKRSSKLVDLIKEAYNYQCQLCDPNNPLPRIPMKDGTYYCEVHHCDGFAESLTGFDSDVVEYVVDHYNNAICCCALHHRFLHHYKSKMKFNRSTFAFEAEDGSLILKLYLREDWHNFIR